MELKLNTCLVRSWRVDDASALQRHANNRHIWLHLRDVFPHPYTLADAEAFLNVVTRQQLETVFAIATPSEAIGCIHLMFGEDVHRKSGQLGYWLAEPYWNRGIMSEVVGAFTEYAFGAFDLLRIYAHTFANNAASGRVLEKAGFTCEGCMRKHVLKDGHVLDAFLYARLRR
jgi:RimJ/RimL family protein N-acetyltransferase